MRIIVTEKGNELLRSYEAADRICKEPLLNTHIKETLTPRNARSEFYKNQISNHSSGGKKINRIAIISDRYGTNSGVATKMISVQQMKITLPKNISEKYNQSEDGTVNTASGSLNNSKIISNHEIPNLLSNQQIQGLNMNTIITNSAASLPAIREEYSLREIIPRQVVHEMKARIKKDFEYKYKDGIKSETNLRSPVRSYDSIIKDVNSRINTKIKTDKINLIYYLNNKKKVSENLINKISSYDDERISRANKICQKVAQGNEQDKVFKKIIENKMIAHKSKEIDDYRNTLVHMEAAVKKEAQILDKNKRNPDDKERYYYIHKEFQKKWDKYKVHHLVHRKYRNMKSSNDHEYYNLREEDGKNSISTDSDGTQF